MSKRSKRSMSKPRRSRRGRATRRSKPGAAPGTLVVDPEAQPTRLRVSVYGPDGCGVHDGVDVRRIAELRGKGAVTWVDMTGLSDVAVLQSLGSSFGLHRLELEDALNVHQRPKLERYGDHRFVVARLPARSPEGGLLNEQLSLFVGHGWVLSVREREGGEFDGVRSRLEGGLGRMRGAGADYMAYALLDTVIDSYYPVLEACGDRLEALEEEVFSSTDPRLSERIHAVRRELLLVRRATWPLREVLSVLTREADEVFSEETRVYLRDCYDHIVQIIDLLESYRELAGGLMDMYLSVVSHRMNDIMKVLTTFASIFIPLSFIAGLYGMNFNPEASPWNMPETQWAFGYPMALGLMAGCAALLLSFFYRKGWVGQRAAVAIEAPPLPEAMAPPAAAPAAAAAAPPVEGVGPGGEPPRTPGAGGSA